MRRILTITAVIIGTAALVIGLSAGPSAEAVSRESVRLTSRTDRTTITYDTPATLRAQLTTADGAPLASTKLELTANGKHIRTLTTDSRGVAAIKVKRASVTTYRFEFRGNGRFKSASGPTHTIEPKFTLIGRSAEGSIDRDVYLRAGNTYQFILKNGDTMGLASPTRILVDTRWATPTDKTKVVSPKRNGTWALLWQNYSTDPAKDDVYIAVW